MHQLRPVLYGAHSPMSKCLRSNDSSFKTFLIKANNSNYSHKSPVAIYLEMAPTVETKISISSTLGLNALLLKWLPNNLCTLMSRDLNNLITSWEILKYYKICIMKFQQNFLNFTSLKFYLYLFSKFSTGS